MERESDSRATQSKYHCAPSWKLSCFLAWWGRHPARPLDHLQLCWWQNPSTLWTISAKGILILLLVSSHYNGPVTRSLIQHTFSSSARVSIRKKTDRRQTVGSHGALFIAFQWNLRPVLACLMKPAPHNEGHWSFCLILHSPWHLCYSPQGVSY